MNIPIQVIFNSKHTLILYISYIPQRFYKKVIKIVKDYVRLVYESATPNVFNRNVLSSLRAFR